MTGFVKHRRYDSGQMLIVMALAITVTFVIGAIAVREGLFLNERRSAQADSDFAALLGPRNS